MQKQACLTKYNLPLNHVTFGARTADKIKPIPESYSKIEKTAREHPVKGNYLETPIGEFRKLYRPQNSPVKKREQPRDVYSDTERENSTSSDNAEIYDQNQPVREQMEQPKRDREAELEILKANISKMYDILGKPEVEKFPQIIEEERSGSSVAKEQEDKRSESQDVIVSDVTEDAKDGSDNYLRIEVENVSESNNVQIKEDESRELLLMVESSVESRTGSGASAAPDGEKAARSPLALSPNMTILVSPRGSPRPASPVRARAVPLSHTDALGAFFRASPTHVSSIEMQLNLSKASSVYEKDYVDEFSADNYDQSEFCDDSPPSLPKTSDDDMFWESNHI